MKRIATASLALLHGVVLGPIPRSDARRSGDGMSAFLRIEFGAPQAFASAAKLAAARQQYSVGDIPSAARTLQTLVGGGSLSGAQLEDARKLHGICQFLLGNKSQAESAFAAVLKINPAARLVAKDVIDPSINTLFDRIRSQVAPAGARAPGAVRRGAPHSLPGPSASAGQQGFTGIFVKTNVKNATIFSGGIFIGTANQDIALDPGEHNLTISAQDYEEVTRPFAIKRNERLTLTVNLAKAGEKERRAALLAAKAKARRDAIEEREADLSLKKRKARDREKDKLDYASDLPPGAKPGRASQSLADEFFRDQQGAGMQPVPPLQQQQQNPYANQRPPSAAPAQAPQTAPQAYPPAQQGYAPPPYAGGPQPVGKKKSLFLALLPFGAGQYQNGNVLLGVGFLGLQLGSLYAAYYFSDVSSAFKNNNINCNEVDETADPNSECIEAEKYAEYVEGQERNAMLFLAGFVAFWAGGATEAVLSMNDYPARALPAPPPPPPAYYGYDATRTPDRFALVRAIEERDSLATRMRVTPLADPGSGTFGLNVRVSF